MRYGSLFSGYAGLDAGVQSVLGGSTAWHVEFDKAPSAILAHHWPDVPNYGDITAVDWSTVEPVDVLTGGYPCQPFSHAGRRQGTNDDRHLWPYVADAIAVLRPSLCVFENVRGHLSLGYDQVLRDMHQLGYDVRWYLLRAADVGAAHGRARLFIFGSDRRNESAVRRWADRRGGLHRDSAGRRFVSGPAQGVDVGQGQGGAGLTRGDVRREGQPRPGSDRGATRVVHLGADGREGVRADLGPSAASTGEGSGGRRGAGVRPATQVTGAVASSGQDLDDRGAGAGCDAAVADSGSEPSWAGPRTSEPAAGHADGCLPLGLVVGAGGVAAGADRVRGSASAVWSDDLRSRLLDPEVAGAVDVPLLPTPAVNDMGEGKTVEHWDAWTATMQAKHGNGNGHGKSLSIEAQRLLPTPTTDDAGNITRNSGDFQSLTRSVGELALLPTPRADEGGGNGEAEALRHSPDLSNIRTHFPDPARWGDYAAAIARWEHVLGRPAPAPTEPGRNGAPRLSAHFCEWLMGLPEGHVTDVPGLTRNNQLKALGNGVVPQQAAAATAAWANDFARSAA